MNKASEYLGIDVGSARVGFARGSQDAKLAQPLWSAPAEQALDKLQTLISELEPAGIVVGLPRNLSGDETGQTNYVRDWVERAKAKIELPFYAQDEALTTKLAEARAITHKKITDTDALAAAIILQDFLDSSEPERVVW